ncbi:hypothetical protein [Roseivirga sp.]|uniref:hypothetical protein n=1 Tax=Roseivirga sp. TaxID=1964215 RepID=UPI003B51E3B7
MKKLKQGLVFLLGLFVAVFVIAQEVITVQCEEVKDQQEQADQDSSQEDVSYELSYQALLPISSISIEPFQAILLAEINFESEVDEQHPEVDVPLCDSPYYKTLFRQIISPNAP